MFTPHTKADVEAMLKTIGVGKVEDLFKVVPEKYRFPDLNLPAPLTEMQAADELEGIASANATTRDFISFLGAGAYQHYIPAAIDNLLQRGEFYTAYTPYQPEISQGTLQAIFEFQSLISLLTGMDVSNASHYDGATAAAEAVILANNHFRGKRRKVLLCRAVNPQYRQVIRAYMQANTEIQITGDDPDTGIDPDLLKFIDQIDLGTSLVMVQYPDFFGRIINYKPLIEAAHAQGALVAVVANPTALALLTPPGELGADIVVGEGQPLGISLSYGGPYLGFFAVKNALLRKISGRLVGETVDVQGELAYVLTLTAREQHIRREKASSNICSNQGLMTLAATIYMTLLGKTGFQQVANLCYQNTHYTAGAVEAVPGFSLPFKNTPFFHEFVVRADQNLPELLSHLEDHGILGGYDLGEAYPELKGCLLMAVTEMISREDIDYLTEVLSEVQHA